jgi:hypothetical protein
MKTYVIGDLQGCHEQAVALLDRIRAHAAADGVAEPAILFAGDLINRGPDSLATLRHVRKLAMASGGLIDSVLGNHDLHLLAVAYGIRPEHKSDTLAEILHAPDRDELIDWVRQRPLAIRVKDHVLVHAGPAAAMERRASDGAGRRSAGDAARRWHRRFWPRCMATSRTSGRTSCKARTGCAASSTP